MTDFERACELYKKDYPFYDLHQEPSEIVYFYLEKARKER